MPQHTAKRATVQIPRTHSNTAWRPLIPASKFGDYFERKRQKYDGGRCSTSALSFHMHTHTYVHPTCIPLHANHHTNTWKGGRGSD